MRLVYSSHKIEKYCTELKEALKFFGGNKELAIKLLSRINALESAEAIKDIILTSPVGFHKLEGEYDGLFSINVKTKKEPWRIIIQPLNEMGKPYIPCNIDEIAGIVRIVEIKEVSKHYE